LDEWVNQGLPRNRRSKGRGRAEGKAVPEAPKVVALAEVVRTCQAERAALGEAATASEIGAFWRQQDMRHGSRPDYLMWRQLREGERFQSRPGVVEALALKGLGAGSPQVRWAVVAMVPALPEAARSEDLKVAVSRVLEGGELVPAPQTGRLLRWLAEEWLDGGQGAAQERLEVLARFLGQVDSKWKVGRQVDLGFLEVEGWLPVERAVLLRWLGRAMVRRARAAGGAWLWQISAWRLRRSLREVGEGPKAGEVEMLLDAGCLARQAGAGGEALRWTALALALLPERAPARLVQRCRVAAWRLVEEGVLVPSAVAVRLDEVPFSGDPPDSEAGRAAAEWFADELDGARAELLREAAGEGDWQVLREAGVVLNHPLAALAWVGKKAVAHAVKKQHGLLEAASRLALRHGCLGSAGKMLAVWPGQVGAVLAYAEALRRSLRELPVRRDAVIWEEWQGCLRAAWGRLDGGALEDEALFLLHETLVDRLETTRRCLPERLGALMAAGDETAVALALEAEPRLMAALEHQRAFELWEVPALLRERGEMAGWVWVSVVGVGEPAAGRYSAMVQGKAGRECWQGRVKSDLVTKDGDEAELMERVAAAAVRWGGEVEMLLLAVDKGGPVKAWEEGLRRASLKAEVRRVPSWEAAFRGLREWHADQPLPQL